jgi:SAM-dependent methyltransferase
MSSIPATSESTTSASAGPALACAWCGAPLDGGAERLHGRRGCRGCGAATTDPQPTEAELDAAYAEWYRPPGGRFLGPADALLARWRSRQARRVDRIAPPGQILDVGAGDGTLVNALAARGRKAVGIERRPTAPAIRSADVRELDSRWAAIVFWHSLEHIRDSGSVLEHAAALLDDGGVLVIAMPNSDSLQARAFGDRWFGLDLARHLVHVPARSLTARLEQLGLRVTRRSYARGGQVLFGWLHGLVGCLPGHPDLYDAIRRRGARSGDAPLPARAATLLAAGVAMPIALGAWAAELLARRGGTVYVEARRG